MNTTEEFHAKDLLSIQIDKYETVKSLQLEILKGEIHQHYNCDRIAW